MRLLLLLPLPRGKKGGEDGSICDLCRDRKVEGRSQNVDIVLGVKAGEEDEKGDAGDDDDDPCIAATPLRVLLPFAGRVEDSVENLSIRQISMESLVALFSLFRPLPLSSLSSKSSSSSSSR